MSLNQKRTFGKSSVKINIFVKKEKRTLKLVVQIGAEP